MAVADITNTPASPVFPPDRFGALKNCAMVVIVCLAAIVIALPLVGACIAGAWLADELHEEETASVTLRER